MPRVSTVKKLSPEAWQFALDNVGLCIQQSRMEYEFSGFWESAGYTQEDLLSIALMTVAEGADKYSDQRGKVSTFIYTCLKNGFIKYSKALKTYKRKSECGTVPLDYLNSDGKESLFTDFRKCADEPKDEIGLSEDRIDLITAIRDAELSKNERETLYYTCVLGHTTRATAAKMNMSPQNVSLLRGNAAKKLRKSRVYSEVAI